ncbi:MAG: ribonuclease J [Oscillospiraceae bacterium]|nr:ribonuclease J [Oscillospiraceae bacterium]
MAEKLKIIPLGGLNEVGKNMTVYEYGDDIVIADCGLGFPDDDMYGVDLVIPDFTYVVKNITKVRAIAITHGHEDHIGAIPYLLREVNIPIFATRLTAGLIRGKLAEHDLLDKAEIFELEAGDIFKAGCFKIEFVHTNHSISDSVALAIKTPVGMIIHTGDFKIDPTPVTGEMIDLTRFGELGKKGVLALLSDSTNVETPGHCPSESQVGNRFDELFNGCTQRIIITTFASNVDRIKQVIDCAAKYGRKVAVTGRSMENNLKIAIELGYIDPPKGVLMELNQIKSLPPEKIVVMTTGSQGEPMSALYRMAFSGHKQLDIKAGDRVIISASAVPGNEKTVTRVINELFRRGAEVIYDKKANIHVSGHACQDDLKLMLALVKPKFFIPIHGECRHLHTHAKVARQMGIDPKKIIIAENGSVIELTSKAIRLNGTVPSGAVFVDGTGVGDVGAMVLRDRKHLAKDGMLVTFITLSAEDGSMIAPPDIITRGFIYVKESEELIAELKEVIADVIYDCNLQHVTDWTTMKGSVKSALSTFLYKRTKRNPMILPVINEV